MPVKLSGRLCSAVPYVRGNVMLADVGTDHAYLPIYLCENNILHNDGITAVASDINKGPVERAKMHISSCGLSDKIVTIQTDGLTGLEKYSPRDIIIFGMGGELMARILSAAPWIRCEGVRLILQPMTHPEDLCDTLSALGFSIIDNTYSSDGDHIYRTICADYTDRADTAENIAECILGDSDGVLKKDENQKALYKKLALRQLSIAETRKVAKEKAAVDHAADDELILKLSAIIDKFQ